MLIHFDFLFSWFLIWFWVTLISGTRWCYCQEEHSCFADWHLWWANDSWPMQYDCWKAWWLSGWAGSLETLVCLLLFRGCSRFLLKFASSHSDPDPAAGNVWLQWKQLHVLLVVGLEPLVETKFGAWEMLIMVFVLLSLYSFDELYCIVWFSSEVLVHRISVNESGKLICMNL